MENTKQPLSQKYHNFQNNRYNSLADANKKRKQKAMSMMRK